jgi:hypothetical protein
VTLLDEIVEGAAGSTPVATLLRQLKIVAARTSAGRLAEWVDRELNGYQSSDGADLPDYRGPFNLQAVGHFVGSFGREATNVPIPPMSMPADIRDSGALFKLYVLEPIAEVEQLSGLDGVHLPWPADVVQLFNWGISQGKVRPFLQPDMALMSAKRFVPPTVYVGISDAVRNRVLDLALELERNAPAAGESGAVSEETRAEVAQVIKNYNFYGSSNVAIDGSNVTQSVMPPAPGDGEALIRYLAAAGVPLEKLDELRAAISEDEEDDADDRGPGRWARVRAWFATASTDVTTNALGGVIGTAAGAFFATR